jgi:secondary thiamine-phosphate synthase enzyme
MQIEIVVPQIGEAVSELTLAEWYKKEGDRVVQGEPLFSVDADKSVVDVESFAEGVLEKILIQAGEPVLPNQVVALVQGESVAETSSAMRPPESKKTEVSSVERESEEMGMEESIPHGGKKGKKIFLSPRAKKLLRERKIILEYFPFEGTGVRGIITERDIRTYLSRIGSRDKRLESIETPNYLSKNMHEHVKITTEKKKQLLDVTPLISPLLRGVKNGIVIVYTPHTTAALFLSEDDQDLRDDFIKVAEEWLRGLRPFKHARNNNPNSEAHLLSALFGTQMVLVIRDGELDIGKYQNLLFLEMDGPKERQIHLEIVHY